MKDIFLALILIVCALTDWKYRKIYNVVIGPGIILALAFAVVAGGWRSLGTSALGLTVGVMLLLIPFAMGGIGAGDVKLMGLVGAYNGPVFVFYAFIGTALIGGLMAAVILLINRDLTRAGKSLLSAAVQLFFNHFRSISYEVHSATKLPYGIAIALGTLGTYWVR